MGVAGGGDGASGSADDTPRGMIGIRLLEAPVSRHDDPRALSYIVGHLRPGTTIERRLEVSNTSSKPRRVELYPAAAAVLVMRRRRRAAAVPGRLPPPGSGPLPGRVRRSRSVGAHRRSGG